MPIFNDDPNKQENWGIRGYKPMTEKWNMYYLEMQLMVPVIFLAFYFWRPTKVNRTTVKAFIIAGLIDTFMYFYDFKDPMYFGSFYVWLLGIWFLVYYWKTERGILVKHLFPKRWIK
jgi:hypothetical protein